MDAGLLFGLTLAELLALVLVLLLFGLAGLLQAATRDANAPRPMTASLSQPTPAAKLGTNGASSSLAQGGADRSGAGGGKGAPSSQAGGQPNPSGSQSDRGLGEQLRSTGLEVALREARRENEALQANLQALQAQAAQSQAQLPQAAQGNAQGGRANAAEAARFKELAEAAAKINPALPPAAVLQDGLRVLETLGPTIDPVRTIQQLRSDSEARRAAQSDLQDYQRLLEAAMKADPNTPPAQTLQRALTSLDANDETTNSVRGGSRAPRSESDAARAPDASTDEAAASDPAKGGGKSAGPQPCWLNQAGETEYLFEITLHDDYLALKDAAPAARAKDAGYRLSRPLLRKGKLDADEFKKATAPLFRSSISQGCRYVVQMRDDTASGSKEAYKMWRSLIESYFFVKTVS